VTAQPRFAELPLHRGGEPLEPAFHHVVVGAGLQCGHGSIFADLPGHDDERNVAFALLSDPQSRKAVEMRQRVVADDDIPLLAVEGARQSFGRVHPRPLRVMTTLSQLAQHQAGVVFTVFDDQNAKWGRHCHPPLAVAAVSFSPTAARTVRSSSPGSTGFASSMTGAYWVRPSRTDQSLS
jgi:hypothetical protein